MRSLVRGRTAWWGVMLGATDTREEVNPGITSEGTHDTCGEGGICGKVSRTLKSLTVLKIQCWNWVLKSKFSEYLVGKNMKNLFLRALNGIRPEPSHMSVSHVCVTSSHVHKQTFIHTYQVWLNLSFQWKFSWLLYVLSSLGENFEPVRSKKSNCGYSSSLHWRGEKWIDYLNMWLTHKQGFRFVSSS